MKATPEAVKSVIQSQGVDTLVAEDMATGEKVWYCQGSVSDLCGAVDELEDNMMQPYRVKLSKSSVDSKRGNRADKDKPFVFVLHGRAGRTSPAPVPQPIQAAPAPNPDVNLVREASANGVRNELLEKELQRANERIEALEKELSEVEEDEGDEEPVNGNVNAWSHPDVVKEILGIFKPIGHALGAYVGNGFKPPAPVPASKASAAPPTADESRQLAAIRNFLTVNGPEGEAMLNQLLDQYAAIPEPAPDGKE